MEITEEREQCVTFELYAVSKNHNRVTWDFDGSTKSRMGYFRDIVEGLKQRVANLRSTPRVCFVLHGFNRELWNAVRTRISSIVETKSCARILISVEYEHDPNEQRFHPSWISYSRRENLSRVDARDNVITAYDIASMCFDVAKEHKTWCNVIVLPQYDLRWSFPWVVNLVPSIKQCRMLSWGIWIRSKVSAVGWCESSSSTIYAFRLPELPGRGISVASFCFIG